MTMTTFFYFAEGGLQILRDFQEKAAPLFRKYGLSIEQEFSPTGQGQLGPIENTLERPDLVQVASLESLEKFQAYLADEEMKRLAPIRASGLRRMTASFGPTLEVGATTVPISSRAIHFTALVCFKRPGDSSGLAEFNRRGLASGLFKRYGMTVRSVARVSKTMTPIGESDFEPPEVVLHFSVDDPKVLKDYLADPEYVALAPLRDLELKSYFFFQGA